MFHCPSAPVLGRSSLLWDCKISLSPFMSWISSYFDPVLGRVWGTKAAPWPAVTGLPVYWGAAIKSSMKASMQLKTKALMERGWPQGRAHRPPPPGIRQVFPRKGLRLSDNWCPECPGWRENKATFQTERSKTMWARARRAQGRDGLGSSRDQNMKGLRDLIEYLGPPLYGQRKALKLRHFT